MYPPLLSLFLSRPNRQGFILPLTLVIGLVMLSLGTVMMARGRDENVKVKTAQNTTVGRGITEAGIAQYQQFLQNYQSFAYYPSSKWNDASVAELGVCDTANITSVTAKRSTGWQAVDSNDLKKGQYRLVSYEYKYFPNPADRDTGTLVAGEGIAPGIGTLVIDGRGAQNLDPSASANTNAIATSRIEVTIPVEPQVLTNTIPGVWLTQGSTGDKNTVAGNVLINDCNVTLSSIRLASGYTAEYTTMRFPALPRMPLLQGTDRSSQMFTGTFNGTLTLPRTTDRAVDITRTVNGQPVTIANVYEYVFDSIDLQGTNRITITPGAKVIFHLRGSIAKGNDILHDCTGTTGCKTTDFQIYGHGNLHIPYTELVSQYQAESTGTTYAPPTTYTSPGYSICLNGNNQLEGFILAPDYLAGVAGAGGPTNDQGGIKGSIWAKGWLTGAGCGSQTINTVVVQTGQWGDLGLQPQNVPPLIQAATDWKQKQVSP